ncbi:MAG TPA: YCF48-related protein [Blastocatellia bacterium]|nr:YCF48-related protein [Blastocatellia bacterium]
MSKQMKYISLLFLLIIPVFLTQSNSLGAQAAPEDMDNDMVQVTGPFGGDVTAMAIDPRNADDIWIGADDGHLFRSTDGGRVWKRLKPGINFPGASITVILHDREKTGVIYVGMKPLFDLAEGGNSGGVYFSKDDGRTWSAVEGLRGHSVRGISQSANDPNALVVAARDGVYYTNDRCNTWNRITPVNNPDMTGFHSVAIDPRDAKVIYVGTHHLPWKTTDAGKTWKRAASKERGMIDDSDIFSIYIDHSNPDTVMMSACSGIYCSLNASKTWTKFQGIPFTSRRTQVIYQHPTRSNVIFAGTTEGLYVSTDGGKPNTWKRMTAPGVVINAVAIHPDRPDRIFLGVEDGGVLISEDGGGSYRPSNDGFINRQVRAVIADKAERGRVYAGVIFDRATGGVFISEDGGRVWRQSMNGMAGRDVFSLYQSESNPATIYAGTNNGLFRSDDRGRNWTQVKKGAAKKARVKAVVKSRKPSKPADALVDLQNQIFAILPFTPVIAAQNSGEGDSQPSSAGLNASNWMIASTWNGVFITEDEKKGWREIKVLKAVNRTGGATPAQIKVSAVVTNPKLPGAIFIGTNDGLFVSRDNGWNFQEIAVPEAARRIHSVVCDPRDTETIYVGSTAGFFRSMDGGRSWEIRGGGMPQGGDIVAIAVSSANPDELYVSDESRGMLYHSKDRGTNWEKVDISKAPSLKLWSLASDPFDANKIYAGSFSSGVYVMSRK